MNEKIKSVKLKIGGDPELLNATFMQEFYNWGGYTSNKSFIDQVFKNHIDFPLKVIDQKVINEVLSNLYGVRVAFQARPIPSQHYVCQHPSIRSNLQLHERVEDELGQPMLAPEPAGIPRNRLQCSSAY
ncbi:unnamed protein product, partial [Mesorhabditis spiculigera]